MNPIVKQIGKMSWDEVTGLQQACALRKQQLRILETSVYIVRRMADETFQYLVYRDGSKEGWGQLNDPELAVYPSFGVADYVRGQFPGSTVIKIPKNEFKTLPAFQYYLKENMVNADGHFNI
jgi:hypothetical protein